MRAMQNTLYVWEDIIRDLLKSKRFFVLFVAVFSMYKCDLK